MDREMRCRIIGGSWNYARLRQLAHKHKNIDQMRQEQDDEKKTRHYPDCNGMFDSCPSPTEFEEAVGKDKSQPPDVCKKCPVFKGSAWYKQEMDEKQKALWEKMMGRNEEKN